MKILFALFFALILGLVGCGDAFGPPQQDAERIVQLDAKFQNGEFDYVLVEINKYTTKYPNCSNGWRLRAWTHAKLDQLEEATDSFKKAIKLDPSDDNAHVGLGVVYRKQGDHQAARKAYSEATRIEPNNAEAFSSLLVIELLEKDYDKAIEYGEKAWALRKDNAGIAANLAIVYHCVNNEEKKKKFYDEAKRLNYYRMDTVDQIFDGTLTID